MPKEIRARVGCHLLVSVTVAVTMTPSVLVAAEIAVTVLDSKGHPVPDVVVYAEAQGARPEPRRGSDAPLARMDQIDSRFVPHILVIETGTRVEFPNNDLVSHHVYSFSNTLPFELGLYRGSAYPPIAFESQGLVVLGCNIHDGMLGYILVVDTPHFTNTDVDGVARLDLPGGDYQMHVWTPRADLDDLPATLDLHVDDSGADAVRVRFARRLHPPHNEHGSALSWEDY
jgi:plastocyanin